MIVFVTCQEVTGHTREELSALCECVRLTPGEPVSSEQKRAAHALLQACAAIIDAGLPVPRDIRRAVADWMNFSDDTTEAFG